MPDIKIGLIGGTGLGQALTESVSADAVRRHEVETPFGPPSDAILETTWAGVPVFILSRHGAGHLHNPSRVPFRANLFALKQLGVTHILASGAVGSLREEFRPRDLVVPDQIIDKTFRRAGTYFDKAAVHVEFAEPFCPVLRGVLLEAGSGVRVQGSGNAAVAGGSDPEPSALNPEPFAVHDRGCYVCMEGPAFSTRAESLMHRLWGGDLIGMTAMPEAKLAKEAEIAYALVALVTDYDCWRNKPQRVIPTDAPGASVPDHAKDPHELLTEILGHLKVATANAVSLIKRAVEIIAADPGRVASCPAHRALELAIWSDKSRIDPAEVQRLAPLWMKYWGTGAQ
ncbi:MAG TPA: MTAP family purine nucleoside phosphorylase [Tepidisphaeraceae bacterium]|nr:MTAP family purine nucleoside phosphorylase [Tepidisphaeraceae bacterium]